MTKNSKYVDIAFLIVLGILLVLTVIHHFVDSSIIPINTYAGFFCWIFVIVYRIKFPAKSVFFVAYLLILAVFNIIGFSVAFVALGDISPFERNGMYFWVPGINPVLLIFFIAYIFSNRATSKVLYDKLFKPGQIEVERNYNFYYEKFSACSNEEFNKIIKMFNDYPTEAQDAIKKIWAERSI